jgi:Fic family protein
MFEPIYKITNKLLNNIKEITSISENLKNRNFSNVVLLEMKERARSLSVFSSTSIEGNPLPLTDVKEILKHKPENIRDSEKEILNYNKALTNLNKLAKESSPAFNLSLILEIQKTVTEGLVKKNHCGKLRKEPVLINDPRTRKIVFMPPNYEDVPQLVKKLLNFINESKNKIDPIVLAGIFHKQFVILHPFLDGNGRTARLATKILLAEANLDTFNLFSFENYYNRNITKYFQEVGEKGDYYAIANKINFTSWLEYFTDGIIDELLRVKKTLDQENKSPERELKSYHKKIIQHIKKHGYVRDPDYAKITERAKPTRNLDFKKLIKLGYIEKKGRGKATYYKFTRKGNSG